MSAAEYTQPNYGDPAELHRLAEIHESAPLNWDPEYVVTEERIQIWVRKLEKTKTDPQYCYLVARIAGELVGTHWLEVIDEDGRSVAHITSLWVHNDFRRQGIATRLKQLGEEWALGQGVEAVKTQVFFANTRMIAFNQSLGFEAGHVEMEKRLK